MTTTKPPSKPIARLLRWAGPAHYTVPHGGIMARTYAEFPSEASSSPDSYWRDDAPLYTAPVQARQPLTDGKIHEVWCWMGSFLDSREADFHAFARAIERAHGITAEPTANTPDSRENPLD